MNPIKKKRNKIGFLIAAGSGSILLIFLIMLAAIFSLTSQILLTIYIVLIILVSISIAFCLIMVAKYSSKPFIDCTIIEIDAYRKKGVCADNPDWFISHLNKEQKEMIEKRSLELENWKNDSLQRIQSEKEKEAFIRNYNESIKETFFCRVVRTTSIYKYPFKRKTRYTETHEVWSQFFSPEEIMKLINKK